MYSILPAKKMMKFLADFDSDCRLAAPSFFSLPCSVRRAHSLLLASTPQDESGRKAMSASRGWAAYTGADRADLCSSRDVRFRISGASVRPLCSMDWRGDLPELINCEIMVKRIAYETCISLQSDDVAW